MSCGSSENDRAWFEQLFRDHADAIYRFCLRRTRDVEQADDARSAVFVEAWRRRAEVDLCTRPARPWLYGVATNVIRNQARSSRRRREALMRVPGTPAHVDSVDEIAERADAAAWAPVARELLGRLSPGERDVVVLCVLDDRSYSAAADELDLPVGTIRSRLFRARARLQSLVGEMHESEA